MTNDYVRLPNSTVARMCSERQLGRRHECLTKADIFAESYPELSRTWNLMAKQWELLMALDDCVLAA
jgi:hypothetical protein